VALTAREIIRMEFGSEKKKMAPHRIKCGKISKKIAFELSWGEFNNSVIYGISVVEVKPNGYTTIRTDLNKIFKNKQQVNIYLGWLKKTIK